MLATNNPIHSGITNGAVAAAPSRDREIMKILEARTIVKFNAS